MDKKEAYRKYLQAMKAGHTATVQQLIAFMGMPEPENLIAPKERRTFSVSGTINC